MTRKKSPTPSTNSPPSEIRKIYVFGITSITKDETEAINDVGAGIHAQGHQLVTAPGVNGVCSAADAGFTTAGGTTEYTDTIPESEDVLIFHNAVYLDKLLARLPDLFQRNWILIPQPRIFELQHEYLKTLSALGINLPKYGDGAVVSGVKT